MSEPVKGGDRFIVETSESDWEGLRYLKPVQASAGARLTLKC